MTRHDHQHPLALVFSLPEEKEDGSYFLCGVCNTTFKEEFWAYRCKDCDYVTHLECATHIEADDEGEEEEEEEDGEYQVEAEDEDADEEEEGKEKGDDGEEECSEEDYDSIIAKNIRTNATLQMMLNNQRFRAMQTQRNAMMRNTRRLFQFNL